MEYFTDILDLVCRAGAQVLEYTAPEKIRASRKRDASWVTAADTALQDTLVSGIRTLFPDDDIRAEEGGEGHRHLTSDRVWIIDPLDGTNDFIAGTGEFSVMIGLAVRGSPVCGVVYQPTVDTLYYAEEGSGAYMRKGAHETRLHVSSCGTIEEARFLISGTHPISDRERNFFTQHAITPVPCGSVGVKIGRIAEGRADAYLTFTGEQHEWDLCAPDSIMREAGGMMTNVEGEIFEYNKEDTRNPCGVLAAPPQLHGRILEKIKT